MPLIELVLHLVYPYLSLILFTALFLAIKFRLLPLRRTMLALKSAVGICDWRGRGARPNIPGTMLAAGAWSTLPGALLGSGLAAWIAGPGVALWIVAFALLQVILYFQAGTLGARLRLSNASNAHPEALLAGPVAILRALSARRFPLLIMALMITTTALLAGAGLPMTLLYSALQLDSGATLAAQAQAQAGAIGNPIDISLSAAALLIVAIVAALYTAAGGVARIARIAIWLASFSAAAWLVLLIFGGAAAALLSLDIWQQIVASAFPASGAAVWRLSLGLLLYLTLSESSGAVASTLLGQARSDSAARVGLAAGVMPIGSALLVSLPLVALLSQIHGEELTQISASELMLPFTAAAGNNAFSTALIAALFPSTILAMASWCEVGRQAWATLPRESQIEDGGRRFWHLYAAVAVSALIWLILSGASIEQNGAAVLIFSLSILLLLILSILMLIFALRLWPLAAHELHELEMELEASGESKSRFLRNLTLLSLTLLPQNLISRAFGGVASLKLPGALRLYALRRFAAAYRINLDEAELPIEEYQTLNHFFTRALKSGVRPLDSNPRAILSPVDGRLSEFGNIEKNRMIQAKGIDYSLRDLLDDSPFVDHFVDGFFMVIYLSPQDYHRIHTPIEGAVDGYSYSPGRLFTVNDLSVRGISGLFPKNERITSYIRNRRGVVALCKVGATNVGTIRLTYDQIVTNRFMRRANHHLYEVPPLLSRGDEIGRFEMGSTVVLLFERDSIKWQNGLKSGDRVEMGEAIAHFRS